MSDSKSKSLTAANPDFPIHLLLMNRTLDTWAGILLDQIALENYVPLELM